MYRSSLIYLLFVLGSAGLLLNGCMASQSVPHKSSAVQLVWPPAPQKAKIKWVEEYRILEDTSESQGLWGAVRRFFLGPKQAHMIRPYGVCTDQQDRLFVADSGGGRVHVFDMKKQSYMSIAEDDETRLQAPIGLSYVEPKLYVTDSGQGAVLSYDFELKRLERWTSVPLQRPTGIAFNPTAGRFYVSDTAAHEVIVLDREGRELFRFGSRGAETGQFNFPTDLWVDDSGRVYVTDALNARIQIFTDAGDYLYQFGRAGDTPGSFAKPKGLAVDRHGHIFISDALFDAVQIFGQSGRLLLSFGDNGTGPGQFWMPSGIFIDRHSRIYVTDTYNHRIQVFKELDD